jgi:hypothetical protein
MPSMKAGTPKAAKRRVRHIRIEGSKKKGYTVSHSLHPAKSKGAHAMMGYEPDPQPTSFSAGDEDAAHQHIAGLMGQMGEPDEDEGQAMPAGQPATA